MKIMKYVRTPTNSFKILRSLLDDYPRMTLEDIGKKHGVTYQRAQQILSVAREANLMPHKGEPADPGVDIELSREYRIREAARAIVFDCKAYDKWSVHLEWAILVLSEPISPDSPFAVDDEIATSMLGELPTVIKL